MTTGVPATRPSRRRLPILDWLPAYRPAWLRYDLIAGLTVWALVVPQAIAYAQIAGLPPQSGLIAAAAGLIAYAILGTSRQLIVSPTSSTAAISAALVGTIAAGDAARVGELSSALALTVGAAFAAFGFLRLGFISRFIPKAVQVGFLFALGLTIIVGQLTKILGVPSTDGSFVDQVRQLVGELGGIHGLTVVVGVAALAILLLARRYAPALPAALMVVVGGIVAVALLDLSARGVEVIGLVEGGLPLPALPIVSASELLVLVPGALAIAMVGSAESLTVAQQFADEHREEIVPDQELIANGGANLLSGLFQGFIVAGGASQSAASDRAGARTQLVSFVCAALVLLTAIALLPLFADLPQAVLGALVISAVLGFVRVDEVQRVRRLRQDSFAVAMFALIATLVLGILPGLLVAVGLSLLWLLVRIARPAVVELGRLPGGLGWAAIPRVPDARAVGRLLTLRLEAPLLFLNAGLLRDLVRDALAAQDPPPTHVILDVSMAPDLDIESLDILVRLSEHVRETGAVLWLAEVRGPFAAMLMRAGYGEGGGGSIRWFRTLEDAVAAADPRGGGEANDDHAGGYDGGGR